MADKAESTFEQLNKIDVSDHLDTKRFKSKRTNKEYRYDYLSWMWAWQILKGIDIDATKEFTQFPEYDRQNGKLTGRNVDYMKTPEGTYVECTVTIKGHSESETLPVMDYFNNAEKNPDIMQINKTKQRCFVKACALQGLGLDVYKGEDLSSNSSGHNNNKNGTQRNSRATATNQQNSGNQKAGREKKERVTSLITSYADFLNQEPHKVLVTLLNSFATSWDKMTNNSADKIIKFVIEKGRESQQ
ncbi:Sak single strand annealing protein [Fructilactobacillus fructivorans]|nr:DUF1071 domain-containing protein [Fructilactobacillus fructivorans]